MNVDTKLFASIGFPTCSVFFLLFIVLMYANKKKYQSTENSIFKILLFMSFICIISEYVYVSFLYYRVKVELQIFSCQFFLVCMNTWISFFMAYVYALVTKKYDDEVKKIKRKRFFISLIVFEVINTLLIFMLSIVIGDTGSYAYNFVGNAPYVVYVWGGLAITLALYALIFKSEIVKKNQKLTVMAAIIFIAVTLLIQFLFPQFDYNIQNFQFTLLLLALYLTLENQDNKLLSEHEEQKKQAEEANKQQTEFLTSMSHEIRTPMNAIIGFSDALITEGAKNETAVKSDVKNIHSAAINLLNLINNILDLSRVESNKETVIEKEYDLDTFIVNLDLSIKKRLENISVKYNIEVDPNLPKRLSGDSIKINKIIYNLVSNIIHYTNEGSFDLKILNKKNENNEFVLLFNITSNGSAIDEDEYNKYYLQEYNSNNINSIILELNIAKLYAKMLDSNVVITNQDRFNIGYSFEIVEQVIVPTPIGDITNMLTNDDNVTAKDFSHKKILVVDDNTINIKLIERFLKELNIVVESVTSGNDCITKVMNNTYDLIFLDHMMPVKDGIQTLKELHDKKSNIPPTVALTANSFAGIKDYYISEGFVDYLAKPVGRGDLIKVLNKYL